jgi:hypothetical protein
LEQVQVTGIFRRGLRLQLVAAFGIASVVLAMPVVALAAETAPHIATQTNATIETRDQAGRTTATATVTVTGEDGRPAAGAVTLFDDGKPLAGAALNADGRTSLTAILPVGAHSLQAVYNGDRAHLLSSSPRRHIEAQTTTTPDFTVGVNPATLTLTAGQNGTIATAITPENASALTSPMFVTLSCSGLPDQSSCTFTPENVEILPNATAAIPSTMVVLTEAASTVSMARSNSITWAILLPGAFGLGGIAWSFRRRQWLSRVSLLALVGLVTMLGTTGCNPRYNYEHHGPPINPATPSGTYTITVTAQSSNGVTAITNSTTFALTVN